MARRSHQVLVVRNPPPRALHPTLAWVAFAGCMSGTRWTPLRNTCSCIPCPLPSQPWTEPRIAESHRNARREPSDPSRHESVSPRPPPSPPFAAENLAWRSSPFALHRPMDGPGETSERLYPSRVDLPLQGPPPCRSRDGEELIKTVPRSNDRELRKSRASRGELRLEA